MQFEKKYDIEFIEFITKVLKLLNFLQFRKPSPYFGTFEKFIPIRKPIGPRLKNVATGSVSKRYHTCFFIPVFHKFYLITYVLTMFVKYLISKKLRAKSLDLEYTFQRKFFRATSLVIMVYTFNNN